MKFKIIFYLFFLTFNVILIPADQKRPAKKFIIEPSLTNNLKDLLGKTETALNSYDGKNTSILENAIGLATKGIGYSLTAIQALPDQKDNCFYLVNFLYQSFNILKKMIDYVRANVCKDCKIDQTERKQITLLSTIFDAIISTLSQEEHKKSISECHAIKNFDGLLRQLKRTKKLFDDFFTQGQEAICSGGLLRMIKRCDLKETNDFKLAIDSINGTVESLQELKESVKAQE